MVESKPPFELLSSFFRLSFVLCLRTGVFENGLASADRVDLRPASSHLRVPSSTPNYCSSTGKYQSTYSTSPSSFERSRKRLIQTCKAFYGVASQRNVWIGALNRICHQNLLFRPTFPVHDMSVAELERAATAPFRWVALSFSEDRNGNGCLPTRTTRILKNPTQSMIDYLQLPRRTEGIFTFYRPYLVPGGRFLVRNGPDCLGVWDLGHVSGGDMSPNEKPPKMWTTRVNNIRLFLVHPSPDGLGIRILTHCSESRYIYNPTVIYLVI